MVFKTRKIIVSIVAAVYIILTIVCQAGAGVEPSDSSIKEDNEAKILKIEKFIKSQMKKAKIPGMSVVVMKDGKILLQKGYGFADINTKRPVTADTLFELGSTSKAFTALGILKLKKEGHISLDDRVDKYLPWFRVKYKGEYTGITIGDLLYQNSGIPASMLGRITPSVEDNALEDTVRKIVDIELEFLPGKRYSYSTVNYDVLGLIIQKISGKTFEDYLKDEILAPMGLDNTYVYREEALRHDMSKGHKYAFSRVVTYDAPVYRGNTPAGYVITNAKDLTRWLKIQMGIEHDLNFDTHLIKESHIPNRKVEPSSSLSSYAAGWHIFQSGEGEIGHAGANPNFYTYIGFRPGEKMGIAVLSNLYTSQTSVTYEGIKSILMDEEPKKENADSMQNLDKTFLVIICIAVPLIAITLIFIFIILVQLFKGMRKFVGFNAERVVKLIFSMAFMSVAAYAFYLIPQAFREFMDFSWDYVRVWGPVSIIPGIVLTFTACVMLYIYLITESMFPRPEEKPFFSLITVSLISGFANAFIIFIANSVLGDYRRTIFLKEEYQFPVEMLLYFIIGMTMYVYGQKLVRTRLINLINGYVYTTRTDLINRILSTTFYKMDSIEKGRIHACLNNDTESISRFARIVVGATTSFVTLVCCFIYLGFMNFSGFLTAFVVIVIAASIYFFIGRSANKFWEQTRDIQNVFFKFIGDLINGFKELNMNEAKRLDFKDDMTKSCADYREKRIMGDVKFANAFVVGEVIFTTVIGAVIFAFPLLFEEINGDTLGNFVFVFLYMTGPVNGLLSSLPEIMQVRISWNRINELIKDITLLESDSTKNKDDIQNFKRLELKDVEYSYKSNNGDIFKVGPINIVFHSGEITFITGGNGSGKSTLAKLITGLYVPDKGCITVNKSRINPEKLGQKYSAVFSDFHLFEKLYGLNYEEKQKDIENYLKIMQLEEKVDVRDGNLSTINLSTGQKKRLALMISFLEDRPIYLLDEWAADQDPEFRKFFYQVLLPDMKRRGKCIIAITHDDRYFYIADKMVKMEAGKIVDEKLDNTFDNTSAS
ncbi:MAG: cyclic peptide export ABC transporter [Bacillota bacterium]